MRHLPRYHSSLLSLATWLLIAGLAAGQTPFAEALHRAIETPRAVDVNFAANAKAIAAQLTAQNPPDLEQVVRQATFVATGMQPAQSGTAWMNALGGLLTEQRAGRVAASPMNVAQAVSLALLQAAAPLDQARAGEFAVTGPAPDEAIVQQLADKLLASEVFRRDVRFTDTANGFIHELSKMLPLVGTKYQPSDPGQLFADEVIQHLEQTVIAKVEGERMKNEWRMTYNAYIKSVKEQPAFAGTVGDWRLAIDRVIRALQSVVAVAGTLPPNPFAAGAAPVAGAAAASGTAGGYVVPAGGWYSHAAVRHERKMSRIIGRNEVRSLRVQRYRGY